MKVFNNIEELFTATDRQQLTAQEIINRRAHLCGEWQSFEVTQDFLNDFIESICDILGGHQRTKSDIRFNLRRSTPQHWGLSRIILSKYGENPCRWSYCAGQDYPSEITTIRKYLSK